MLARSPDGAGRAVTRRTHSRTAPRLSRPRRLDRPGRSASAHAPGDALRATFRRSLWNSYDHLGLLVLANLVWLALCLPVITAPAASAGLAHLAKRIASGEPVTLRDLFVGFRKHFPPAVRIGWLVAGVAFLLWINVDFYARLAGRATFLGALLAAVMVWVGLFLALMHAHLFPLIAGGERSLRAALRKSALLVLDNPAFTIGVALQAVGLVAICLLTGVGLLFAVGSLTAVLLATAHRELLKKYFPDSPEAQEPEDARGLRDVLRPWEAPPRS